jgi:phosphomannomutase/phosphoglucomutase
MIFRAYDIRGIFGDDLTTETAEEIGKAYGTYLDGEIIVGMDNRPSSGALKNALIKGLISTGMRVIDIGIVPIPVLYFTIANLKKDGGIMVTASHNPPEYNGFKLNKGNLPFSSEEIQNIRSMTEKGEYKVGRGVVKEENMTDSYIDHIKEKFKFNRLKVVIDAGNGTCGSIAPRIFTEFGCEVIELYCELDGNFPNHFPDPTVEENLTDLRKKVMEEGADMGIAYDGDGDRVVFIDDTGKILKGDQSMVIFARDLLKRGKGGRVLFEVKCSSVLREEIEKSGGTPLMLRVGHSFFKRKMQSEYIPLGGETSGHFYFSENFCFDDGIYASVKMASIISDGKSLSEIFSTFPRYPSVDLKIPCPDDMKFEIVDGIKRELEREYRVISIDGVRVELEDGWGLLRASNTEACLITRYEAKSEERLREIEAIFEEKLKEFDVRV